jgi:hypothetical protein
MEHIPGPMIEEHIPGPEEKVSKTAEWLKKLKRQKQVRKEELNLALNINRAVI